jgi:hypothetical protein
LVKEGVGHEIVRGEGEGELMATQRTRMKGVLVFAVDFLEFGRRLVVFWVVRVSGSLLSDSFIEGGL